MPTERTHRCHNQTLLLSSERAIYWQEARTLIVADLHLGKELVFQRSGIAVPSGSTENDLRRLASLVQHYRPDRLLVLGDLVHALPVRSEPWLTALSRWIDSVHELQIVVTLGNHDKSGVQCIIDRRVTWVKAFFESPFLGKHHPGAAPDGYVLSGHLHPVVSLSDGLGEHFRLPVFWFAREYAVLPAFASFVGGSNVTPSASDYCFIASNGKVLDHTLPSSVV